jgi:paraquat-inducible protein A
MSLPLYILAGGQSTRFGSDKARARIDGRPLILRLIDSLAPIVDAVHVVAPPGRYADLGFAGIPDLVTGKGPIGGLLTALAHRQSGWLALVSCDITEISPDWFTRLTTHIRPGVHAIAVRDDHWQSLAALYHTDLLPLVRQHIDADQLALHASSTPPPSVPSPSPPRPRAHAQTSQHPRRPPPLSTTRKGGAPLNPDTLIPMPDASTHNLRACPRCGLIQRVPAVAPGNEAHCSRCDARLPQPGSRSNQLTVMIALAALICYPVGISLPVLRMEKLGYVNEASVWSGSIALLTEGQVAVGLIVLVCSIIIPILKLLGLLILSARPPSIHVHHQARIYRAIEQLGKWGMIDVLLVAVVIAALKLGDIVSVTPGPGLVAFTACVLLSLIAAATFDPHAIWDQNA